MNEPMFVYIKWWPQGTTSIVTFSSIVKFQPLPVDGVSAPEATYMVPSYPSELLEDMFVYVKYSSKGAVRRKWAVVIKVGERGTLELEQRRDAAIAISPSKFTSTGTPNSQLTLLSGNPNAEYFK